MRYALSRWHALTRFVHDGHIEIDNSAAERAIRGIAIGRKNYLFAGSDTGGNRAAAIYSLIETCKLNVIDPEAYMRDVLARIPREELLELFRGYGYEPVVVEGPEATFTLWIGLKFGGVV